MAHHHQQNQHQHQQQPIEQYQLTISQMLTLVAQLRLLRTSVPPPPDDRFTAFFDTQKVRIHALINGVNSWQDCMRMATAVRNDILSLEAQWRQWQQTNFASTSPKQISDLQLKAHVEMRVIYAIADRLNVLATDPAVQAAAAQSQRPGGPQPQNPTDLGPAASGAGSAQQDAMLPLEPPVPSGGPARIQRGPDGEEVIKELIEKLSLVSVSATEISIEPDRSA